MPMSPEYEAELRERRERPFRFEDLPLENGKRIEPEEWGPIYSKPPTKPTHMRYDPPTNAPSGQKTAHVDDAKLRAKIKAEFAARCNAERKAWASSREIAVAYEQAMIAKRARERVEAGYLSPRDAFRQAPRKPHYLLRAGKWQLAA